MVIPRNGKSLPRIASLVPSLTELLASLGLAHCLVARTGYCIHPADALQHVPKVGGTKTVNLKKLRQLAPTHVLVNVDENRLETISAIDRWDVASRPEVVVTHPCAPQDNLALVQQMVDCFGDVGGVQQEAARLSRALTDELAMTATGAWPRRQVLYLIWRDPWMTVATDTYLSQMLAQVGWATLPDEPGGPSGAARYPLVGGDEAWLAQVQLALLSSEPYSFGSADLDSARLLCPNAEVRLVDGELLSWYGPRAVAGLRYLRELAAQDSS